MGEMMKFDCPDGSQADGYLATAEGSRRAVVVLQEWWGLNDQMKGVADRLAGAGYHALAPDLYHGRLTQDPDEANHFMSGLDWVGATEVEVRGAARRLKQQADKVAVMGFCMGGALTIIAGVKLAEVDAAVCYYGIPPAEQANPAEMKVPFLGHFATRDDWCTPQAVEALKATMKDVRTPVEFHSYEAAHAFFNEKSEAYSRNAADASWDRTLRFLEENL